MIEVRELTKRYRRVLAVDHLSFSAVPGRVTGFLGPNGAGKTTTLKMIAGLVKPTSGTSTIHGTNYHDLTDPARRVGMVLESTAAHPARTGRANMMVCATSIGMGYDRVGELLGLVGLAEHENRRAGAYSLGMRQRLMLAMALLGDPPVLILDEPGNGLDPSGTAWLRNFLKWFASQGRTVLVSSHQLSEMSQLADDVVIVSSGHEVVSGPLDQVIKGSGNAEIRFRTPEPERLAQVMQGAGGAVRMDGPGTLLVGGLVPEQAGSLVASNQIVIYEMVAAGGLEETFLALTGNSGQGVVQ
ncbi:MAG: ABC transporter ATP-binding protein [Acidimicrobiales bacterium]